MLYKTSIYNNWYEFHSKRYLFNSHSGTFSSVTQELYDYIIKINENKNPHENVYFDFLIRKGIIVPADLEEFNLVYTKSLSEKYGFFSQTLSFVIATTRACNYRCRYCFEETSESSSGNRINMTTETQNSVIKYIKRSLRRNKLCKELFVTWFGGEPLLNKACIKNISEPIIQYCKENDIKYSATVITNGSLIDQEFINMVDTYKINSVQITFDGTMDTYCRYKGALPDQFHRAVESIFSFPLTTRLLVRLNTDFINYPSIKKFVSNLLPRIREEKKENSIIFYLAPIEDGCMTSMFPQQFTSVNKDFLLFLKENKLYSSIKQIIPTPKKISCGLMKSGCYAIDATGALMKCEHYIGDDSKSAGDVFSGSVYNENEMKFTGTNYSNKCTQCSIYPICHEGCIQKRIDRNTFMDCDSFRSNVENILYVLSDMPIDF